MTGTPPLDWRLTEVEKNLSQLVDLVTTLTDGIQALHVKVDGAPAKKDPGPSRWAWQHATADQAAWLWAGLGPWVRWLTDRYPTQLRELPPCWHLHGDAVEELTALWASWMSAYHDTDQPRDDMIYWHDRWFPGTIGRLLGPSGTLINCAKAKQHREPNLAGAPRLHFDGAGTVTIEEHAAADVSAPTPARSPSKNTPQPMSPPGNP